MKKNVLIGFVVVLFVSFAVFQSCQKEEPVSIVNIEGVENSKELEEYIIAGADYYQSLMKFQKELRMINFADLEFTTDSNGIKTMSIGSLITADIDEKAMALNVKKKRC